MWSLFSNFLVSQFTVQHLNCISMQLIDWVPFKQASYQMIGVLVWISEVCDVTPILIVLCNILLMNFFRLVSFLSFERFNSHSLMALFKITSDFFLSLDHVLGVPNLLHDSFLVCFITIEHIVSISLLLNSLVPLAIFSHFSLKFQLMNISFIIRSIV